MAGGKLSPRQKMVNLMYLVFISMLAMNMSKEVLSAFGFMKEKLVDLNNDALDKNNKALEALKLKATEQPDQFGKPYDKAKKVADYSKEFYNYLEELENKLTADLEDKKNYEAMDGTDKVDAYFFTADKTNKNGKEFLKQINDYRTKVAEIMKDDADIVKNVNKRFDTADDINDEGLKVEWIKARYEGFPLITTLANIEQMQSDVKNTESEVLSTLLGGQLKVQASLTNFDAMVVFDKSAYYPGEQLSGKIVLGKNDPTLKASKVIVNGQEVNDENIQAGQVLLSGSAGNVGEHELKGNFFFMEDGKEIEIPITGGNYSVIPEPGSAVISADKMNVVYRGLDNPMSISIPGLPDNKVTVNAPGLKKIGTGKYNIKPGQGREVKITASGKLPSGKTVTSSSVFRIKNIPKPAASIRKQTDAIKLPKSSLEKSTIEAFIPDFDFNISLKTQSFKIKIEGQNTIVVNGNRLNDKAKRALKKARPGSTVTIFGVKATMAGVKIKEATPLVVTLQ
ncbi:type IX secretion system motor protein PorM/GldM [Aureivirga marina]|uniref:type IX secretion system motor protein PorM/GldM n=1 Tax=Aureivirga marina TaxID=1182451 RepID=UPI0018C9EAFB|nr:gliding motility protein GldM [Aureivirga marina]